MLRSTWTADMNIINMFYEVEIVTTYYIFQT